MEVSPQRNNRRTRLAMLVVLMCIAAAFGGLYVAMKSIGRTRAADHKVSFYQYVIQHHIGTLTDIDDGTGFDPNSYVLTLSKQIPDSTKQEFVTSLMKHYVEYDSGQLLTIVYEDPKTQIRSPLADVNYDDDAHLLSMTLTLSSGTTKQIRQHVDW